MPEHSNMVRKWRRWLEMTQADLAAEVGVSRQTIANIEKGNYSPSVYLALDICKVLGKSVEEVFNTDPESVNDND
ncbi:helix-turn-helix transcriptional regulator [Corynebacterium striatum]|uniref:Transcriptional regulator n=2 Tax=Corynebacterium striatum TaxID=43770 RepID=A0A2Z2J450_CORST|nr:helix-turn-helix transcriptional regulator [Corynebacterium striatum]ART21564.1 transcriptional regulator [Corynebacterium striatum]NHY10642.1 helix-turn-helix transcriptional regulator [Corynebacterium striatum]NHY34969.1 helix-turn-helix transcriptional regulator [Corynebacterium striatum]HAT1131368.1 helix-turn-helix transcriptional regulator [Corynebacterium striatum]HAT1139534.1 helix-turn-helix transcriptional regulator [Corynebacterium striatum]